MSHQRKHPKQIGVNIELAKKERDRKTLKIGKERRANTIQLHRKVMVRHGLIFMRPLNAKQNDVTPESFSVLLGRGICRGRGRCGHECTVIS